MVLKTGLALAKANVRRRRANNNGNIIAIVYWKDIEAVSFKPKIVWL